MRNSTPSSSPSLYQLTSCLADQPVTNANPGPRPCQSGMHMQCCRKAGPARQHARPLPGSERHGKAPSALHPAYPRAVGRPDQWVLSNVYWVLQNSCLDAAAAAGPEFVFVQTRDAVEFCQAVMAGTAARRSEEGRGRGGISPAPSGGRPASPHVRRTVSAVADGPLAPVAERDVSNLDLHPAAVTSPFERQSRVSWEK